MMAAVRRIPVVVILGATGTGKSKLSIELGRHFKGEIISADSMQLYKGLDIITAKVTAEEQAQCPHHLLSVLSPLSMNNTVVDFKNMALPIVDKLLEENKMPVIVGGTNYYIEALLWDFLIDKKTVDLAQSPESPSRKTGAQESSAAVGFTETLPPQPLSVDISEQNIESSNIDVPDESDKEQHLGNTDGGNVPKDLDAGMGDSSTIPSSADRRHSQNIGEDEISNGSTGPGKQQSAGQARQDKEGKYAAFDSAHLHQLLGKVDADTARRLHPQNRRKIVRALQVFDSYGVPMSKIHHAQHASGNTPGLSGALRYPHCCVFWLQSEQKVLDERLDKRVEEMLRNGLVSELHDLHLQYLESIAAQKGLKNKDYMLNSKRDAHFSRMHIELSQPDYTLGIFQSIGFKEFHNYLILPPEQRETQEGKALFHKGVEDLKLATRQYARRQLKWIKNRFVKRPGVSVPPVYSLDSTDPSVWDETVLQPAVSILSAVCDGREVPIPPMKPESLPGTVHVQNVCDICGDRVFTTLAEWQAHLGSRKHKKALHSKRRREKTTQADQQSPLAKQTKHSE